MARENAHLLAATLEPWFQALDELYAGHSTPSLVPDVTTSTEVRIRPFGLLAVLVSWIQPDPESCRAVPLRCLLEVVLPAWSRRRNGDEVPSAAAAAASTNVPSFDSQFTSWLRSSGVVRSGNDKHLLQTTEQQFVQAVWHAETSTVTSLRELLRQVAPNPEAPLDGVLGRVLGSAHRALPNRLDPGHDFWVRIWLTFAATQLNLRPADIVHHARSFASADEMSDAFVHASCLQLSLTQALWRPSGQFRCEAPPDFTDAQSQVLQHFVHGEWLQPERGIGPSTSSARAGFGLKRAAPGADEVEEGDKESPASRFAKRSKSAHSSDGSSSSSSSSTPP